MGLAHCVVGLAPSFFGRHDLANPSLIGCTSQVKKMFLCKKICEYASIPIPDLKKYSGGSRIFRCDYWSNQSGEGVLGAAVSAHKRCKFAPAQMHRSIRMQTVSQPLNMMRNDFAVAHVAEWLSSRSRSQRSLVRVRAKTLFHARACFRLLKMALRSATT